MGNRLLEQKCLRCGADLICDYMGNFNEFNCCSQCSEYINKCIYEAKKPNKKGKRYKSINLRETPLVYVTNITQEPE